jgi:TonB-linked SusC/RagA family outer membrane protein
MTDVATGLNEVVVVGYGTESKRDVTGAVSTVKSSDINSIASSNFAQSLAGKAAGVQVTQATGQPGANVSIQLRSNPSNASGGVLYVIDGVPVNDAAGTPQTAMGSKYGTAGVDQSPLNFISPDDIASITFLKDASSAAIYGARAGAGVVLITTKKGISGPPKISYTLGYGVQRADKLYDMLNTQDYMTEANLVGQELWMRNNKIAPWFGTVDPSTVNPFVPKYSASQLASTPNYPSAMQAIFRQGFIQNHNLSISGGNDKTSYLVGGSFFDQQGVLIHSGLKQYNGNIKLDQTISKTVKMGTSVIVSYSRSQNANTGGIYQDGGAVIAAQYYPANMPLIASDGSYPVNPQYTNIPNPLSYNTITDFTDGNRLITSGYAEWEIIKGLTAKGNFSYDQSAQKRYSYFPMTFLYGQQVNGVAAINENEANSGLSELTLNYKRNFIQDKLGINILAGYSYQVSDWNGLNAGNQNFVSDAISYYNLGAGQALSPNVGSSKYQQTWASYFTRGNFSWEDKYILQVSLRKDGSSSFATNKKWGYFPSISGSWIISQENFMNSVPVISNLKLRAGYGETGNSSFGGNAFEIYNVAAWASPIFGTNTVSSAMLMSQAANPNLTWETAGELNVGLDFGLLKNRITGSVDIYNKTIRNLITQIPLASDNIVSSVWGNAGTTRSQGYEVALQSRNIVAAKNDGFSWTTTLNFSHYLNYWVQRSAASLATLPKYVAATGKNALFNGYYGYEATGLFTGQYGTAPSTMPNMLPGGIIIKDIHGYDTKGNLTGPDGLITAADQTLLFNWDPQLNFGFGNTFTFKNFDLNIFFSGQIKKALSPYNQYPENIVDYGWNLLTDVKNDWTVQNTTAKRPGLVPDLLYNGYQSNSSYWVVNASFIRCQDITLGYSLPKKWLASQKVVSSLRIYVDIQNMFTITSYPGVDPELSQSNYYPYSKSYMAGLNVSF